MIKICKQCNKEYKVIGEYRKQNSYFCSRECKCVYFRGKRPSMKTEFKKGIVPKTAFKKGLIPWNKGLKGVNVGFPKGKPNLKMRGQNHPLWKGGITPENHKIRTSIEFELWRQSVFSRDNWTCQKYGIKGGKLHAHHIQNFAQYPELRFAIDNGTTLSEKAHKEFHKKYGIKNNTKEQLVEFLNSEGLININ